MSIGSDFSKISTNAFQAGQGTQLAQDEFVQARQKETKVVNESADSSNTKDATKDRQQELSSRDQQEKDAQIDSSEVEDVNVKMRQLSVGLSFEKSEDGQDNVVKVIDQDTGDLVRQIPSEEFIEMSKRLDEIFGELNDLKGNLVNSKV